MKLKKQLKKPSDYPRIVVHVSTNEMVAFRQQATTEGFRTPSLWLGALGRKATAK